jgi:predicted transposase/invertase (TIGR01784 family)
MMSEWLNPLNDKEALGVYQMREMALSDRTSGFNPARREGMREGILTGRQEIAGNLKKMGLPVGQIAHATGLSAEEIETL